MNKWTRYSYTGHDWGWESVLGVIALIVVVVIVIGAIAAGIVLQSDCNGAGVCW